MKPPKPRLNEAQRTWVREWWRALQPLAEGDTRPQGSLAQLGRGARAQLRRCEGAQDLLAQSAVLLLAQGLVKRNPDRLPDEAVSYERLAWVAGVLARVKDDLHDGKSLARHLGKAGTGDQEAMSERRFKAMQRCTHMPDLYMHWRRAVQLADGKADVARLADDLLAWQIELSQSQDGYPSRASDGIRFHWAFDYYLSAKDQDAAASAISEDALTPTPESIEENAP